MTDLKLMILLTARIGSKRRRLCRFRIRLKLQLWFQKYRSRILLRSCCSISLWWVIFTPHFMYIGFSYLYHWGISYW